MITHPAARFDFNALAAGLEERVLSRHVSKKTAPDAPHLATYCYTDRCTFERAWDEFTSVARGIVLDHSEKVVRALPFPKFFNHGENSAHVMPDLPFEVQEKLDGSLGIVFHDGSRWRVATKGSFISEQAAWGQQQIKAFEDMLTVGSTYLFELIYRANKIVVPYDYEGMVLLGAYDSGGDEYERGQLEHVAGVLGVRICETYKFDGFAAMMDAASQFAADKEGFVVRFSNGYRVKVKGAEYLRVHKLISRVTPIALWEAMAAGDDTGKMRMQIPEEFWGDFDNIHAILRGRIDAIVGRVNDAKAALANNTDKEVGQMHGMNAEVRQFIFLARKGGDAWHEGERARTALFRHTRPTGNVLEGYTSSVSMNRVQQESK